MSAERSFDLGLTRQAVRRVWDAALTLPFRDAVNPNSFGIARAEQLMREEKLGLMVLITHFSRSDPIIAMKALAGHPYFGKKRIVAPVAAHQMLPRIIGLRNRARSMGVDLFPVVTENTVARAKLKNRNADSKVGDGKGAFTTAAIEALKGEGIVVWAPQGERQPTLGTPKGNEVAGFIRNAQRHGVFNFAVMFMGFEINGVRDYSSVRDFNWFKRYDVNVGVTMTVEEILKCLGGDIRKVDNFAYGQLARVSPPSYLTPRVSGEAQTVS